MMPFGTAEVEVNIGSGNGLLPNGTKPSPEPMLTYHQYGSLKFILDKVKISITEITHYKFGTTSPRAQWVKQNDQHFADSILKCISFNQCFYISSHISLRIVTKGPIDNRSALVRVMACN